MLVGQWLLVYYANGCVDNTIYPNILNSFF